MHIKSIVDHLVGVGKIVPYQDLIMCIIRDLNHNYLTFISSLSMRSGSLTFAKFQNLLITHERMLVHHSQFYEHNNLFQENLTNLSAPHY